ncbi:hypothetical protein [Actinomadura xylanilytica]|uniref:hypothetical protein n=1 Tax=Actinomadura xylanilytica TaxID=887459 RepID=UPI00255AEA0B|nr:hypothetical protein [Actinomadura xylanilytica]MDL4771383.1 hypothetical protein [Actinomadura xylanilytica]
MTGDLGSVGEGAHPEPAPVGPRPDFLPHVDRHPPPPAFALAAVPEPRRRGTGWSIALIAAAAVQLVSAFLPWAQALVVVDLFGRPLSRNLGTVAGIDADDLVISVPVLALVTIAMTFWGFADPRITALGAITGTLTLLACGLFVLRLGDVRDHMPDEGLGVGYQIGLRYGWYVAVATSLLVIGLSLAHPVTSRLTRRGVPATSPYLAPRPEAEPEGPPAERPVPDEAPAASDRPSGEAEPEPAPPSAEGGSRTGEEGRSQPEGWTPPDA